MFTLWSLRLFLRFGSSMYSFFFVPFESGYDSLQVLRQFSRCPECSLVYITQHPLRIACVCGINRPFILLPEKMNEIQVTEGSKWDDSEWARREYLQRAQNRSAVREFSLLLDQARRKDRLWNCSQSARGVVLCRA